MNLITIILIGISLSMDAFSLSLFYGSKGIEKNEMIKLTISVGIFHFIMPIIGYFLGNALFDIFNINSKILICIILNIIGIEMILDSFKKKEHKKINCYEIFAFSLAVSLDSFTVGIGLNKIITNIIISPIIFAISSSTLTFIGLKLGGIIKNYLGAIAQSIGGIILISLGLFYIM